MGASFDVMISIVNVKSTRRTRKDRNRTGTPSLSLSLRWRSIDLDQPIDHYLSTEYSVFLWRIYSGVYGVNVGDGEKDNIVRGFGAKTLWSFRRIERKKMAIPSLARV